MRVLFVEDDDDVRFVVADALRDEGFEVLEAANGTQALQYLTSIPPIDLLFTDILMPGLTGWEVAQRFRDALPEIPVIYATGYANEVEPPVSGSMFFHKPYRIAQVISSIHALLGSRPNNIP